MAQDNQTEHEQDVAKLRELIKDIDIGMLTTIEADGTLHSRPMSNNKEVEFDGDLWFFTDDHSPKVDEVQHEHQVNVSFARPDKQSYVSMSGTAIVVRDKEKIKQWWKPELKVWFPAGPDAPGIALLKVTVNKAEYWDATASKIVAAVHFVKGLATGERPNLGENKKIEL